MPLQTPKRVLTQETGSRLAAYVPTLPAGGALHPGVAYRRTTVATNEGPSFVDVVEIAPGSGEFRVVGESYVPRTLSELSSGGLVGINAGYFRHQRPADHRAPGGGRRAALVPLEKPRGHWLRDGAARHRPYPNSVQGPHQRTSLHLQTILGMISERPRTRSAATNPRPSPSTPRRTPWRAPRGRGPSSSRGGG